jgi:poly-gamma-glutamate synthesis protein (capsule biosynthesis protein)
LIDKAGVDIVHGHSSHHVKGIEVYKDRPILYGCGDFLNDYEGIRGHEVYRNDLALMYFVSMDPASGKLKQLQMIPTQTRNFRINLAKQRDIKWLMDILNREGKKFNTWIEIQEDLSFLLQWD